MLNFLSILWHLSLNLMKISVCCKCMGYDSVHQHSVILFDLHFTSDGVILDKHWNYFQHGSERLRVCAFSNFQTSWVVLETHHARNVISRKPLQWKRLKIKAEISYVNGEEAKKLVDLEGYSIVDVRDNAQFNRAHISSCYHVPLFIENQDNDPGTVIKRTVHNNFAGLFFGLSFTKTNPEFVQSVKNQFSPESKLLLVCQEGLRSTAAARKLEQAGFQNLACIVSGLQSVKSGTFDSVGSSELQDAGKAGLITVQGKISAVLGTILVCAFLFITFFPEQAEKLFQMAPAG